MCGNPMDTKNETVTVHFAQIQIENRHTFAAETSRVTWRTTSLTCCSLFQAFHPETSDVTDDKREK